MATRIYGIDKGAIYTSVTEDVGSATTKGMELTIDLAKFTQADKHKALLAIEELKTYITRDGWIPA